MSEPRNKTPTFVPWRVASVLPARARCQSGTATRYESSISCVCRYRGSHILCIVPLCTHGGPVIDLRSRREPRNYLFLPLGCLLGRTPRSTCGRQRAWAVKFFRLGEWLWCASCFLIPPSDNDSHPTSWLLHSAPASYMRIKFTTQAALQWVIHMPYLNICSSSSVQSYPLPVNDFEMNVGVLSTIPPCHMG
jgi:hypothetical protein